MNGRGVQVRELAAWSLDEDEYRPALVEKSKLLDACRRVEQRIPFQSKNAVVDTPDSALRDIFAELKLRPDLQEEMAKLEWSIGMVDLRLLLAFQRRLVLNLEAPPIVVPDADDWAGLVKLSFGPPKPVVCDLIHNNGSIQLQSSNPDLHFRISTDPMSPVLVHGGSPFFEVACYRDRWFLRDGYHRAYFLLRAGIVHVPAVIVQARSLAELGAVHPWFFPEEVLFSSSPPRVTDFLDDTLVLDYNRPPLIKTLRLTMEETYIPAISPGDSL